MEIDRQLASGICDFTRHIVQACELDSASIFLCDRMSDQPELSYLFHTGISEEVKDIYYSNAVFHDDPFTDPQLQEQPDRVEDDTILPGSDRRVERIAGPSSRYRQFMYHYGIDVIGASTRRLMPGVYSTIGFHRKCATAHKKPVPMQQLDQLALRLQDMVAGHMLREILDKANGLSTFRTSYFKRTDAASSSPLSRRESEIAHLVCQGKLNKEIAYLTSLSEHTVENHLRRIYAKLSIHNRSSLVAFMTQNGGLPAMGQKGRA
ncbi:MAG: helix-turn-helix transcriptional regulator [Sphingobium sp.]